MVFVSQYNGMVRRGAVIGITVRFVKPGATSCYLSSKVRCGLSRVELELDEVTRQVRVKCGSKSGFKLSGKAGGNFTASESFGRKVIPAQQEKIHIPLALSDDGWWYGSYAEAAEGGEVKS